VDAAMSIMLDAAKKRPQVLAEPEPAVILKEFADSGINVELTIWVEHPEGECRNCAPASTVKFGPNFRKMA
jgi:small-conductance mechanosensitive channel